MCIPHLYWDLRKGCPLSKWLDPEKVAVGRRACLDASKDSVVSPAMRRDTHVQREEELRPNIIIC